MLAVPFTAPVTIEVVTSESFGKSGSVSFVRTLIFIPGLFCTVVAESTTAVGAEFATQTGNVRVTTPEEMSNAQNQVLIVRAFPKSKRKK